MDQPHRPSGDAGDVVAVRYRRTAQDVRDAVRAVRRVRPTSLLSLLLVPAIMALGALVLPLQAASRAALLVAAAAVAALYLLMPWIGPHLNPRRWGVGPEHHVELTPAGLRQGGVVSDTAIPWVNVERVVATPTALVAVSGGRPQLVVPRRRIADAEVERALGWWAAARDVPAPVVTPAATPGAPGTNPGAGGDGSVTEARDGTIVVVGRFTPERARLVARAAARPSIAVAAGLVVLGLALALALTNGDGGLAVLDGVLAVVLVVLVLTAPSRVSRRLLAFVGDEDVTWTYTPQGLGIGASRGHTELPWARVRDAQVRGDMLVVRTEGVRAATGGLVGPLTPEQVDRVLGWAAAGRGTGRPASRLAG